MSLFKTICLHNILLDLKVTLKTTDINNAVFDEAQRGRALFQFKLLAVLISIRWDDLGRL